ncbi:unnamed protein product [Leptidea sinapis]|uniref:Uncharacterized protein n=1 Tax=Leptidea sinapis TaxID=189913 RepID=A0A5E4PV49_9NEOP|nr:unnamed protein product [Leptidea sinapis]
MRNTESIPAYWFLSCTISFLNFLPSFPLLWAYHTFIIYVYNIDLQ